MTNPLALHPATSDTGKISFNQIIRNTGHRIKYLKVDPDTGEEVSSCDIIKGYKVDTDTYVEVSKDELENIAVDSTRAIEIDEYVPKNDIDPRYLIPALLSRFRWQGLAWRLPRDPRNHVECGRMSTAPKFRYLEMCSSKGFTE